MKVAEAFVEIRPKPSPDFDREMQSAVGPKVDAASAKMSDVGRKLTAFAALPIAAGFTAAANAASDLAEATNVTGLVFNDARGEIDEFVKTTAEGLGQSERAAREATATFGGLLKNLGLAQDETVDWSMKLTTLASDLGSAFNRDPAEAVEALGSALRGETEPIRAFNVMLDDATVRTKAVEMGLAASSAEVDKAGKAQATLALIMEQTADVQGDFANTSDGLANQQRILKARLEDTAAQLGTKLLPIFQRAVGGALTLVDAFSSLDSTTQTAVLALGGAVALVGPLSAAAGNASKAVSGLQKAMVALATSTSAVTLASAGFGSALIGAATVAYAWARVGQGLKDLQAGIREQTVGATNAFALYASGVQMSADEMKQLAIDGFTGTAALRGWTDEAGNVADAASDFQHDVELARSALVAISRETDVSKERIAQLATEMGINLAGATDEQRQSLAAAVTQIGRSVTPTERLAETADVLGNEFATSAEEIDAFREALDAALGTVLTADEAAIRFRQQVLGLAQELAAGKQEGEGVAEMNDRLALSTVDVVRAAMDEVAALTEAGKISADAAAQKQALWERLNHLREIFPQLRTQIEGYIWDLARIPESVVTRIELVMASEAQRDAATAARGGTSQLEKSGLSAVPGVSTTKSALPDLHFHTQEFTLDEAVDAGKRYADAWAALAEVG